MFKLLVILPGSYFNNINIILIKSLSISPASESDFASIKQFIQQFELDNRDLHFNQFLAAKHKDELVGFGRIREHSDCSELCSLGVIEPKRKKGIGKKLVEALILKAEQPLFLVCIIPEFFTPFDFKAVATYPTELKEKLNYCTRELVVKETYVVMKHF